MGSGVGRYISSNEINPNQIYLTTVGKSSTVKRKIVEKAAARKNLPVNANPVLIDPPYSVKKPKLLSMTKIAQTL